MAEINLDKKLLKKSLNEALRRKFILSGRVEVVYNDGRYCSICRRLPARFKITRNQNQSSNLCQSCSDSLGFNLVDSKKFVENILSKVSDKSVKSTIELSDKSKPYIDAGLSSNFAEALVSRPKLADEILTLWESDWWGQYEPEDSLIQSILVGKITEEEGKWLNTIRSDHIDLVEMCIEAIVPCSWAQKLMESGFQGNNAAVKSVLAGGDPRLIARIKKISGDNFPPPLSKVIQVIPVVDAKSNSEKISNLSLSKLHKMMRKVVGDNDHNYWKIELRAGIRIREWKPSFIKKTRKVLLEISLTIPGWDVDEINNKDLIEKCREIHIYKRTTWSHSKFRQHVKEVQYIIDELMT